LENGTKKTEKKMSSSRDTILKTLRQNKPEQVPLPDLPEPETEAVPLQEKFSAVAIGIGSRVFAVKDQQEVKEKLEQLFPDAPHVVSEVKDLSFPTHKPATEALPHSLATVELAILRGKLAVAENSAI
jgi:L-lactate dehydrogenase complex protein LldG